MKTKDWGGWSEELLHRVSNVFSITKKELPKENKLKKKKTS